jgi:hypothetical protein
VPKKTETLRLFGHYSLELAQRLKEGAPPDADEQMFIENHLLIVQLALAMSRHSKSKRPVPVRGE